MSILIKTSLIISVLMMGGIANAACTFVFVDSFEGDSSGSSSCSTPVIRVQKLNDTGITTCGTESGGLGNRQSCIATADENHVPIPPGQDGHYGTGINGSKGKSLTSVSSGQCVQDNHTGLLWEVKQGGDGSIGNEGLHDADDKYTWYSDSNNGGNVGFKNYGGATCYGYDNTDESTHCNTQAYVERVNAEGWCGYNDWRLPTLRELRTIVDYSHWNLAIDTNYFPQTIGGFGVYWSSSPFSLTTHFNSVWGLKYYEGGNVYNLKRTSNYVRLVRSGQ